MTPTSRPQSEARQVTYRRGASAECQFGSASKHLIRSQAVVLVAATLWLLRRIGRCKPYVAKRCIPRADRAQLALSASGHQSETSRRLGGVR